MINLSQQNCLNHSTREAAARCPECRHFYCRECISEHDDRVICATCLKRILKTTSNTRDRFSSFGRLMAGATGIIVAWLFFYWAGQIWLSSPDEIHEENIWKTDFWEE